MAHSGSILTSSLAQRVAGASGSALAWPHAKDICKECTTNGSQTVSVIITTFVGNQENAFKLKTKELVGYTVI